MRLHVLPQCRGAMPVNWINQSILVLPADKSLEPQEKLSTQARMAAYAENPAVNDAAVLPGIQPWRRNHSRFNGTGHWTAT